LNCVELNSTLQGKDKHIEYDECHQCFKNNLNFVDFSFEIPQLSTHFIKSDAKMEIINIQSDNQLKSIENVDDSLWEDVDSFIYTNLVK